MSFMMIKLVYTVSNTWESWKQWHETPIETNLPNGDMPQSSKWITLIEPSHHHLYSSCDLYFSPSYILKFQFVAMALY